MPAASLNAYLATRVKILSDRLLPAAFFRDMLGQTLETVVSAGEPVPGLTGDTPSAKLDRLMKHVLLGEVAVILRPLQGSARRFFLYWARRFELFNLKAMIRGKLRGLGDAEIETHLLHMPPFTVLPHERMLRTETVAELLRLLEGGPYASLAGQARRVLEEKQDTHAVEAAIDQRYYMGLAKRVHQLAPLDVEPAHALMGLVIDRINLAWLVRYRFVYGLTPTETYYYLIRHGALLHRQRILRLVELESLEAVVEHLPGTLQRSLQGVDSALGVEQRMDALLRDRAERALRLSPSMVTRAMAYLILREQQLDSMRALIQGKRLGLDVGLMSQALLGDTEAG